MPSAADRTALRQLLRERGVQVNALAAELGLERSYLSTIVNGWARPSVVRRWGPRIAAIVRAPVETLFPELSEGGLSQMGEEAGHD